MISEKTIRVLELDKILEKLAEHTSFTAGADLAYDLNPSTNLEEAKVWQKETTEVLLMFENNTNINLNGVRDVRDISINAQRGVLIDASVMLDIRTTLRRGTTLKRTIGRAKHQYPLMAELLAEIEECPELVDAIGNAIDDNAEVKDSASAKLAIIRRDMKIAFDRLQTKLNRIISSPNRAKYLQEAIITTRNGRYVVPLIADHKGKIKGIIHDSSSSGATIFIEPLETVELNNQYRELQLAEEKEIRRILLALSSMVGNNAESIVRTVDVLAYVDLVMAKARLAEQMNGVEPILVPFKKKPDNDDHPGSTIFLKGARHPLLPGNVVPIDVEFDQQTWVLVVTGPNTGGKTVALKTVGLFALMAQSGLHVPSEEAKFTIFTGIYADIGDEQSIEQSLSTFSSHMTNTIRILDECDDQSLVILDEVGAGTDPAEGSALARAILSHLLRRRATTMVSTHHPELKIYSVETPGVRNASVEFDLETLAPTYRLIIGLPGRSNALSIASRLGLSESIIEEARGMVALEDLAADDLLDEIHRTREEIRRQHDFISEIRQEVEEEKAELQSRLDKIEDERRDIINSARRHSQQEIEEFQKEVKRLRSEMRTASMPLQTLQAIQETATKLANATADPIARETEDVVDRSWMPRIGDTVWLETLNAEGEVIEVDDTEAMVQVGALRVRAKLDELQKRNRSQKRQIKRGHVRKYESDDIQYERTESPGLELDLRGQRVDAALSKLDHYVDAAYTAGLPFARIIHGKGTGALRKAVRDVVDTHPLISKVERARPSEGGDGVTVIHMVPLN